MSELKKMYSTMAEDPFPSDLVIKLGDAEMAFAKRTWTIDGETKGLRYGENPDQPAALYAPVAGRLSLGGVDFRGPGDGLVCTATEEHLLQAGKHPGKINLTDVDNGINILQYLSAKPAVVILKHNNPCGAAWSDKGLETAFTSAYAADRIAAFGGVVVVNRTMDAATAKHIAAIYMEVVAAPDYEPEALELLKGRKNLRIFKLPGLAHLEKLVGQPFLDIKSLADGGMVLQFSYRNRILAAKDFLPAQATDADGATIIARSPTPQEAEDLLFAWAVEAGVSSNSVIFAKNGVTVAIGTGEQDRVGVVELTIHKAKTKYADNLAVSEEGVSLYELTHKADSGGPEQLKLVDIIRRTEEANGGLAGSVVVSDGFFPFRDGVDLCIRAGATAIAQPGGSIRDAEAVAACNEAEPQVAMVFTWQRSFRH